VFQNSFEVSVRAVAFLNIHERPLPLTPFNSGFLYVVMADMIIILDIDCFQTHCTIFRLPAQQRHMLLLTGVEFRCGEYVLVRKRNHTTTVSPQPGLQYRCHCTSNCRMNTMRLTLAPSVICYTYYNCCPLSGNKMSD